MLRFFRINDPYRLIFIFLILIGIRFVQGFFIDAPFVLEIKWLMLGQWLGNGFNMYRETYDYTGPLAALSYKYIDIIFGRSATIHHVISSLLIIIQAGIFNSILLRNKAYDENSYLPAFFYVILALSVPDFRALSPQLMSVTFILLALGSVLRRIDNQATDELFLNSGLFVGIATMLYLPAFVFFIVFLASLIIFSSAIARRLLIYLFGFLLIFGLCAIYFFWRGDYYYFIDSFLTQGLFTSADNLIGFWDLLRVSSVFIAVLLLTVFKTFTTARLTNFQQRVQQVIWFMFLGGIACFFLSNKRAGLELIFVIPLISYFLTHYFLLLKKRLFSFFMPFLVVFGLLGYSVYNYGNSLKNFTVDESPENAERILILDEDFSYYLNKEANTPCMSYQICREAFEGLAYYESATHIYKWLERSNPELIIDRLGVLPSVFERFPKLAAKYDKRSNERYILINN